MASKSNDDSSLSHTRWNCKYHIVFIPKYRRKAIYGKLRVDIGGILRQLCTYKNVEILEAHAMKEHIHMLVKIPPKLAVSSFMGYLKGKSSLMIFERHANLKYKYGNRNFWAKGYYVSTVGLNTKVVEVLEDKVGREVYIQLRILCEQLKLEGRAERSARPCPSPSLSEDPTEIIGIRSDGTPEQRLDCLISSHI